MTNDAAEPGGSTAHVASARISWRMIAVLATAVLAALALYGVGVLLPYFANGLHRLPLAEVAGGAHDPKDLWPQNGWAGPVQLAGLLSLLVVPPVFLAATGVGGVWLALLWRRPAQQRVPKSLAVLVVVAVCASTLLFLLSPTGGSLGTWRLD